MNKRQLLYFLFSLFLCSAFAQGEKRLALVIGNSEYASGKLNNAVNDANMVAEKLKTLGFDVILKNNVSNQSMGEAINTFTDKASNYDVSLFYYAGHGIQSEGSNYLIPINDDNIKKESDIKYYSENVSRLLGRLEDSDCKLKIVILDACRNNPFERSWYRSTTTRGLHQMDAPYGTLIQYATGPGKIALDGSDSFNSPYAAAFLQMLDTDLPILEFFSEVCNLVYINTEHKQMPWMTNTAINRNFRFNREKNESISNIDNVVFSEFKEVTINVSPSNATIKLGNLTCKDGQILLLELGKTYSYVVESEGFQSLSGELFVDASVEDVVLFRLSKVASEELTKIFPWFWSTHQTTETYFQFAYHYSPIFPMTISCMFQPWNNYPLLLGTTFGSSPSFYNGWLPKIFIESGVYEYRRGLLEYTDFYEPDERAEHYESNALLLASLGYRPCNGIMLEFGVGFAHQIDKYYMHSAYYKTEYNDVIGGQELPPKYNYEQMNFSQWYKGDNPTWSFGSRLGVKTYISMGNGALIIGSGWVWTPNLKRRNTWDICIGYNFN